MADFEWFRSFIAIYRQGSVSSAAALRHMTQPALTQHLAALEAEIGEPLFYRTPRKMVPTERGRILYTQIVQAMDRLENINSQFMHSRVSPILRIGGPVEYMHERFIRLMPPAPYTYSMVFGETRGLLQQLKAHEIDVMLATQHIASPGLVYTELTVETFMLVGHKDEPGVEGADLEEIRKVLETKDWIAYHADLPIIRRFWREAFTSRASMQPRYIVPDLRLIKQLVMMGRGISVLPDYLIRQEVAEGLLKELWTPPRYPSNQLWLVYRTSDQEDPAFVDWLNQVTANAGMST